LTELKEGGYSTPFWLKGGTVLGIKLWNGEFGSKVSPIASACTSVSAGNNGDQKRGSGSVFRLPDVELG
jgi:hypothetical protein